MNCREQAVNYQFPTLNMKQSQKEALWRVLEAVKEQMPDDVNVLSSLLEERRRKVKEIMPGRNQTQLNI
jgi:hypothetical protein